MNELKKPDDDDPFCGPQSLSVCLCVNMRLKFLRGELHCVIVMFAHKILLVREKGTVCRPVKNYGGYANIA